METKFQFKLHSLFGIMLSVLILASACQEEEITIEQDPFAQSETNEEDQTNGLVLYIDKPLRENLYTEFINLLGPGVDANGDGMLSWEELVAVIPNMQIQDFINIDLNVDGLIDAEELAAAVEAGIIIFKPKKK